MAVRVSYLRNRFIWHTHFELASDLLLYLELVFLLSLIQLVIVLQIEIEVSWSHQA